jgi:hypothetical protein
MPLRRTRQPAYVRLKYETLHIFVGDGTACGVEEDPLIRLVPFFGGEGDDFEVPAEFWDVDADKPTSGACRRCAAGLRWFTSLFMGAIARKDFSLWFVPDEQRKFARGEH